MKTPLAAFAVLLSLNVLAHSQTSTSGPTVITTADVNQAKTFTGRLSGIDTKLSTLSLVTGEGVSPLRYSYTDQTEFSDENGNALTPQSLETGTIASLTYLQAGTNLIIVSGTFSKPVEPVASQRAAVTTAPIQVIKTTKPAAVVRKVPAPVVEETTTTTTTTKP